MRYDVSLERAWLNRELGLDLNATAVESLRLMDAPANVPLAYGIGAMAAERQVLPKHLFPCRPTAIQPSPR